MAKWWISVVVASTLLSGCASVQRGSIPVEDSSGQLMTDEQAAADGYGRAPARAQSQSQAQSMPQDSGVVVMVPGGASSAPLQTYPDGSSSMPSSISSSTPLSTGPISSAGSYQPSAPSMPSGIPSGNLAADEQLDGPVLALLTTAQQQQGSGDLNGAASSLERAQRIAPREPQVLYRLAEVRLAQGDAAQAEQFARRGLTYANGRPALQASLWNLIGQARERQGDPAGAAQARERARVNL
ncbi:tetratricopeptide repeat protein [Aquipseudomonas ullengensis]|uniref:Tetratricopeptide repeat protein n=1 Tax=Aquipseudomonas ullengensis TaxID=2759166 RepID=A0A7W4LQH7_9GAMM|nr:tetratricopeptide repeat protein [Pseudomonas ullengensis]MBB2497442.1 tetratricopeptide repeat protein [Pseudomonas ullengensis]